ncbi:hypothetical protein UlMin_013629 [Ulmus minor]
MEQQFKDRDQSEIEMDKVKEDLLRRVHDQQVAREILTIPFDDWRDWGGIFEKPFGEGSSKSKPESECVFRLYFKGLVREEKVGGETIKVAGIGVAICDPKDNLIFEVRKPLPGNGLSKISADAKALIEGLNAATALELKRIILLCDNYPFFQFISRRWHAKQRKVAMLVDEFRSLQSKFAYCKARQVPRTELKFAFKLARDAIVSQINKTAESSSCKNLSETCVICLEETTIGRIFSVDGCLHRYCFSCMEQHVEVKLRDRMVPKCPHENCKTELDAESCEKFLTPKYMGIMRQCIKEASTPVTEKVYCPYPRCSFLMSKTEVLEHSRKGHSDVHSGARKCVKCNRLFCINCKVPWHRNVSCAVYKSLNPEPVLNEKKVKILASMFLWRQCVKCNQMIELAEGCYHMTCRCGYEFCYSCGAEYKGKKATCTCPLWDEHNILQDFSDYDEEFDDEEEDEDDFDDDFDSDDSEFY